MINYQKNNEKYSTHYSMTYNHDLCYIIILILYTIGQNADLRKLFAYIIIIVRLQFSANNTDH